MEQVKEFVRARIAEEEASALEAIKLGKSWVQGRSKTKVIASGFQSERQVASAIVPEVAAHVAHMSPARTLRGIEFYRMILELPSRDHLIPGLAAQWSNHRDYNPEWSTN